MIAIARERRESRLAFWVRVAGLSHLWRTGNGKRDCAWPITGERIADHLSDDRISRETRIMGLAGLPVTHSISPYILNAAFESAQFDGVYLPFEVRDISSLLIAGSIPAPAKSIGTFLPECDGSPQDSV